MPKTLIIAEAGVNHNGDEALARELIKVASNAGADAVKFQTFKAESLATNRAPKANYQKKNDEKIGSQVEMLRKLELDHDCFFRLSEFCKKNNIQFMSTAFDLSSADFLVEKINQDILKIPSGEIINEPYLLGHARFKKKIILSTGMATLAEIESALGVIAFGLQDIKGKVPGRDSFLSAYTSLEGQKLLKRHVSLLHCTTEYPTSYKDVNLKCITTLASSFGLPIGFSDHTDGILAPIAAVALGASIVEKHFTLDKKLQGPDHSASLEPGDLESMVSSIRHIEMALGSGIKMPTSTELLNRVPVRQSIVAIKDIEAGEYFSEKNIGTRRPGSGMHPALFWDVIGKKARCDFKKFDEITL
jgi:N-acetylneuraminate synthase|tara:strand:- start:526 stop:1605 length:1080 start_codon:yes stop_codon:yes gene_type:complete